ncbi:MAG: signal peptide peptidase SppA [Thermofilaceae archaeon]
MGLKDWQLVVIVLAAIAATALLALLASRFTGAWTPTLTPTVGYVALIRIEGTIAYGSSQLTLLGATSDAESIARLIEQAAGDAAARAVVLLIDSPGGSAAASEHLYLKVRELASKKPVVAYIRGYGTSGAYMAALPARLIVASNSSIVGSVGVYLSVLTYSELLEKLGVRVYVFKSGELKDVGSPYRQLTPQDAEVLEGIVQEVFDLFKQRVLAHRKLKDPSDVFTGKPYTAKRALEIGLIDRIGTLDDAARIARELAGLPPDAPLRELKAPRPSLLQLLFGSTLKTPVVPSVEILAVWPPPTLKP